MDGRTAEEQTYLRLNSERYGGEPAHHTPLCLLSQEQAASAEAALVAARLDATAAGMAMAVPAAIAIPDRPNANAAAAAAGAGTDDDIVRLLALHLEAHAENAAGLPPTAEHPLRRQALRVLETAQCRLAVLAAEGESPQAKNARAAGTPWARKHAKHVDEARRAVAAATQQVEALEAAATQAWQQERARRAAGASARKRLVEEAASRLKSALPAALHPEVDKIVFLNLRSLAPGRALTQLRKIEQRSKSV